MLIICDILLSFYARPLLFLLDQNKRNLAYRLFLSLLIDFIIGYTGGLVTLMSLVFYFLQPKIKNYYVYNLLMFFVFYLVLFGLEFPMLFRSLFIYLVFMKVLKRAYN